MTDAPLTARRGSAVAAPDVDARRLRLVASVFALAVLFHNADHLRRGGDSVSSGVFWLGSAAIAVEIGVVVLARWPHPIAPLASTVAGLGLAAGYLFVHFTPPRGLLSDSFVHRGASPLSITAALLETATALALASVGWRVARRRGWLVGEWRARTGGGLWTTARQPIVVILTVGNAVIFVGSLATR